MDTNFHIFVIIATIIAYVLINSRKNENNENGSINFNFIYIPLLLYTGHYIFYTNKSVIAEFVNQEAPTDFEELLSEPFPASTSASF